MIARLAFALALTTACGRIDFDPLGDARRGDGGAPGDAPCMFGAWGAPTRIAELATAQDEYGAQIMADNLTLYFDRHASGVDEIFVAQRPDRASPFGQAQPLAELGTNNGECCATLTPDQLELYFESARSGTRCLYRSERASTAVAWNIPAAVAALCTSPTEGAYITQDGLTLYYNSATPPTDYEGAILVTTRATRLDAFGAGQAVSGLAAAGTSGYPALSGDEATIYFESHSSGAASTHLWQATRATAASFTGAVQITTVNSSGSEQDVSITTDGLELFFASTRPPSMGEDLWVATRSCQ